MEMETANLADLSNGNCELIQSATFIDCDDGAHIASLSRLHLSNTSNSSSISSSTLNLSSELDSAETSTFLPSTKSISPPTPTTVLVNHQSQQTSDSSDCGEESLLQLPSRGALLFEVELSLPRPESEFCLPVHEVCCQISRSILQNDSGETLVELLRYLFGSRLVDEQWKLAFCGFVEKRKLDLLAQIPAPSPPPTKFV